MPFILSKVSTQMTEAQEKEIKTRLGIHALPAYLLSYGGHEWILPFIENACEFTLMIDQFVKPGANAISWTGTVTKVVVRPNWRFL